jgi:hypothetical protein
MDGENYTQDYYKMGFQFAKMLDQYEIPNSILFTNDQLNQFLTFNESKEVVNASNEENKN